jgi:membrane protein implicated in regulation of membrane protease activity
MSPLVTALVSFGAFVVLALVAKVAIWRWMKRNGSADADKRAP